MKIHIKILLAFVTLIILGYTFTTTSTASCIKNPIRCNQFLCKSGSQTYCCSESSTECQAPVSNNNNSNNSGSGPDVHGNCGTNGISTAIGCIHFGDTNTFLSDILRWAVGIGGGIAFVLMLYSGFMIMTATGNPERIKAGQELLTSAISGLILLILSIFILKFIGVDILGLNNLGFNI